MHPRLILLLPQTLILQVLESTAACLSFAFIMPPAWLCFHMLAQVVDTGPGPLVLIGKGQRLTHIGLDAVDCFVFFIRVETSTAAEAQLLSAFL